MVAIVKIKVRLTEGNESTQIESVPFVQVKKEGPITAGDVKALVPTDLFDASLYTKEREEVWGSNKRSPLNDEKVVHWRPDLTYVVYVKRNEPTQP
jgi:hypothetical protein